MKNKWFKTLLVLVTLASCNNNSIIDNSSSSDSFNTENSSISNNSSITKTMRFDYGKYVKDYASLLYGSIIPFFDTNNEKLYAGDVVKVSYTGELLIQDSYPEVAKLDGKITNVEVILAEKIYFSVISTPGGGYSIISDNPSIDFALPEYFVVDDGNFYAINNLYDGLKFVGTRKADKQSNELDGLYAINFDESKINIRENTKTIDEELNDYCDEFNNILNEKDNNDYYYSIVTNTYKIESQKVNDVEYFKYNSTINTSYTYEINKESAKLYANGIIYDATLTSYKSAKDYELMDIMSFLKHDEPLKNNEIYNGYLVNLNKIDPCCDGPVYLVLTKGDIEITLHYSYKKYELQGKEYYINEKEYLSFDEYIKELKNTAKSIKLSKEYAFLQEIKESDILENYNYIPGFGIFKFFDKKYDGDENNIVFYESYAFPDCSFTINSSITHIFISDKEFGFNDLTLNDSVNTIIKEYQKLGFTLKNTCNDELNNKVIYTLFKSGINITISAIGEKAQSISFAVLQTNIFKIVY